MAINPKTTGIHHIALRCTDMNTTKDFYQNTPGFTLALDSPEIIAFLAGPVLVQVTYVCLYLVLNPVN
jgi:catechol 2,3-dioxygenase-like lactoylglutathione lyase family enzyme